MRILLPLILAFLTAATASAQDLKLPAIFGDHMVLQAQSDVPVWGMAAAGSSHTPHRHIALRLQHHVVAENSRQFEVLSRRRCGGQECEDQREQDAHPATLATIKLPADATMFSFRRRTQSSTASGIRDGRTTARRGFRAP